MIETILKLIKIEAEKETDPMVKQMVADILKNFEPKQKQPQTEIFEYLTKRYSKKNHKVGVVVGFKEGDKILIGWAKCNIKLDKFDKETGIELAKQRAKGLDPICKIPDADVRQIQEFQARCLRYFKDAKVLQKAV